MRTKITCVSDLHGEFPKLPGGDLLILGGDYTESDRLVQWGHFFSWVKEQNYTKKIMIAGNHDNFLLDAFPKSKQEDFEYLCDSGTEYEGIKIWGSPWTKTFQGMNPHCKAFTMDSEQELYQKFSLIPEGIDILVCHSPAYLFLDSNARRTPCGSMCLHNELYRSKPTIFICGHIHENGGKYTLLKSNLENPSWDTLIVNSSYMNENYEPVNKIISIEYENSTKEWKILD